MRQFTLPGGMLTHVMAGGRQAVTLAAGISTEATMAISSKRQEQAALAALQQWKRSGTAPPAIGSGVRRRLEIERLAQADEFGQTHITERGAQRLHGLDRTIGHPGTASPFRRRSR